MNISLQQAEAAVAAASQAAEQLGIAVNIAVLDAGVHLKAFGRMDGAYLGSIDVALNKAKTSALFGEATEVVGEWCKPDNPAHGLERTNGGLIVFGGGVPVKGSNGQLIGAVGVSGGSPDQDAQIARAAADAVVKN
jgi:uncharacterized protein GlcG (DUF336 family)